MNKKSSDAVFMQRMTELKGLFELVSEDEQPPEQNPALDLDNADESLEQLLYTTDNRIYWNAFSNRLHRYIQEIQRQTRSTRITPFNSMRKEIVMGYKDEIVQSIEMDADELVYNSEDDKLRMVRMMSIVTSFYCDMRMCDVFGYVSMEGASLVKAAAAAGGGGEGSGVEEVIQARKDEEKSGKIANKRNSSSDAGARNKKRVKEDSTLKPAALRRKSRKEKLASAKAQTEAYRKEVQELTGKDYNVALSDRQKQLVRQLFQRVIEEARAGKDVYNLGLDTEKERKRFISHISSWTGQRLKNLSSF